MTFDGFPMETVRFLSELSSHNEKAWFNAHRAAYDQYWVEPAKAFVEVAGWALQELAPVSYEPRINGSINRDVRFSKDERPYKDHGFLVLGG